MNSHNIKLVDSNEMFSFLEYNTVKHHGQQKINSCDAFEIHFVFVVRISNEEFHFKYPKRTECRVI